MWLEFIKNRWLGRCLKVSQKVEAERSILRRLEDVENDLREMKVRRMRGKASNIGECAYIVKEAKVPIEPQGYGTCKCVKIHVPRRGQDFFKILLMR
jgi:hypothetical protein